MLLQSNEGWSIAGVGVGGWQTSNSLKPKIVNMGCQREMMGCPIVSPALQESAFSVGRWYRCVLNTNATHTVINIESIPEVGEGFTSYDTGSAGLATWGTLLGLGCAVWWKVLGESSVFRSTGYIYIYSVTTLGSCNLGRYVGTEGS